MTHFLKNISICIITVGIICGCDSGTTPEITTIPIPDPIDASNFSQTGSSVNTLFPLTVGATSRFIGQTTGGLEEILVEVTDRKKLVQGVTTTVIRDRVWLDGELIEDTDDWYAQDNDGNVWYLGEDVKNYEDGILTDRAGSWESGVDGALAGIIMHAQPRVGTIYYQEYYRGEAEDVGEVLAISETVDVPYGTQTGCVKTEDTTPLEPDVLEYKYFCPGLGHALTIDVTEGNTRFELVDASGYN
ncbi:MAG: hypothetical protein HKN43_04650 [Rhodothermales bacterium]|nr:hypothetical protein [Rhodothermales bacterium]